MKNTLGNLTFIAGFSIFWLNPSHADARIWKDVTGKHSVEAESASLDGDSVGLKTPSGKLITLSLAKLSLEDQAIVKKLSGATANAGVPAPVGGENVTVKMNLIQGMVFANNVQRKIYRLHMDVTAVGGMATQAYAVGPISVEPLTVGGNTQFGIEMNQESAGTFIALELYAADGHEMDADNLSNSEANGVVSYYKSAPAADLKGATLKLKFRDGGREIDIPFNIPQVTIDQ